MQRRIRRLATLVAVAVLPAAIAMSCFDGWSGPTHLTGRLAFAPAFRSPAATIVDVDHVRVIVTRADDGTVAHESVVQVPAGEQTIDLSLEVPVLSSDDTFLVTIECYTASDALVFAGGPIQVTATLTTVTVPTAVEIPLDYVGTGYDAERVQIVTTAAAVDFGDTILLLAEAIDSSGGVIAGTPMIWTSRNAQRASIPDAATGEVAGEAERGPADIVVQLLTGQADTTTVQVNPVPDNVIVVSGDGQTALIDAPLPDPLVVRVMAVDGLGVGNVSVGFSTPDGGTFSQATVVTDNTGTASTSWTLGSVPGLQTATAAVTGVPGAQATFAATASSLGGGIRWASAVDGDWSDPTKWDPAGVPSATDTVFVTVPGDYTVMIDANVTVAYLTLGGAASGTQTIDLLSFNTLTVDSLATIGSSGTLIASSATLAGADILVDGILILSGGSITGNSTLRIRWSGRLEFPSSAGTMRVDGRTIDNLGTFRWSGGDIVATNGAQIVNQGVMDMENDHVLSWDGVGAEPRIVNSSIWTRSGASGFTTIDVPVENSHEIQVATGRLEFRKNTSHTGGRLLLGATAGSPTMAFSAGTHTLDDSTTFNVSNRGVVQFSGGTVIASGGYDQFGPASRTEITGGSAVFDGANPVRMAFLDLRGGTLGGTATVTVTDSARWTSGSMEGAGVTSVLDTATMVILGTSKRLDQRTIDNSGTIVWESGHITSTSAAQVINRTGAMFEMQSIGTYGGVGTLQNDGTFLKSSTGVGTVGVSLGNAGTLDVQAGILILLGQFTHADGAVLRGAGTIDFTSATVAAFDGDVNPGTSPGLLSLIGDIAPSTLSTLNVELNGTGQAGIDYDQLTVSGDAAMGGRLNIATGFAANVGDRFTVLTYGSASNHFTSITGLDLGGGLFLDTLWGAGQLDLEVIQPPLAPEIVFAGSDIGTGGQTGIFTVAPDGSGLSNIVSLASLGSDLIHPVWSPNRSRIAYTYQTFGPAATYNELFVISADGTQSATAVNDTNAAYPRWSPDGRHLAFECYSNLGDEDVCVIPDVTGSIASLNDIGNHPQVGGTRVAVTDFVIDETTPGTAAFAWHPTNHDLIAFVRDEVDPVSRIHTSRIYTANFDGTNVQLLSPSVMDVGNGPLEVYWGMDWEPNGAWIAFDARDPQGGHHIYRIDANGTNLIQLTSGQGEDSGPVVAPSGAPGGVEILFGRFDPQQSASDAWIVNSLGVERQLTNEAVADFLDLYYGADWSPSGAEIVVTLFQDPLLNPGCNLLIYKVPWDAKPSDYRTRATLIGRNTISTCDVLDIQPSWRP